MEDQKMLLRFLKALADGSRLKLVSLLARQSYTVEQLAVLTGLGASTVSHHLSKLAEAGLVTAKAQSYYNYYRLEREPYEQLVHRLLTPDQLLGPDQPAAGIPAGIREAGPEHRILRDYLQPNGRLKTIPAQRKKLLVILRYLQESFEPGRRYSEAEVNTILGRFHSDTASLRRELISARLMERESSGQAYWLVESEETHSAGSPPSTL